MSDERSGVGPSGPPADAVTNPPRTNDAVWALKAMARVVSRLNDDPGMVHHTDWPYMAALARDGLAEATRLQRIEAAAKALRGTIRPLYDYSDPAMVRTRENALRAMEMYDEVVSAETEAPSPEPTPSPSATPERQA